MDQHFEDDVMQDLMVDTPRVSADDAFENDSFEDDGFEDGFSEDGMEDSFMMDSADGYDESGDGYMEGDGFADEFSEDFGDEFAEEDFEAGDAMEEAVADALDAEDSDEFLRRLIGGIRRVAGAVGRGAGTVRRVAGTAQRVAGQVGNIAQGVQNLAGTIAGGRQRPQRPGGRRPARPGARGARGGGALPGLLQQLMPMLRQHLAQGSNEMDVFEDLADWFEDEDADEALPIIAGVAARAAIRPLIRRGAAAAGRVVGRQLVRSATQAARTLVNRQGPQAVRALRPIARSVGQTAARRNLRPAALPSAIRQTAARVAAQPALARRLSRPAATTSPRGTAPRSRLTVGGGSGLPRRFIVNGPVEIIVRR